MPINFFNNPHAQSTRRKRFGICDDIAARNCPTNPAYIDEDDEERWTAEVLNPSQQKAVFYPIDNCINIVRPDGSMDNRCDGMLGCANRLFFIELKDRDSHGWIAVGIEQLKVTLRNFRNNHDVSQYSRITAHLCNKQRPSAVISCKTAVQQFYDETGIRLYVDRKISI